MSGLHAAPGPAAADDLRVVLDPDPPSAGRRLHVLALALLATAVLLLGAAVANPPQEVGPVLPLLAPIGLRGVRVTILQVPGAAPGPAEPTLAGSGVTADGFDRSGPLVAPWQVDAGAASTAGGALALAGRVSLAPPQAATAVELTLSVQGPPTGLTFLGGRGTDRWTWLAADGSIRLVRTFDGVSRTFCSLAAPSRPSRLTVELTAGRFTVGADGVAMVSVEVADPAAGRIGIEAPAATPPAPPVPVAARFTYEVQP